MKEENKITPKKINTINDVNGYIVNVYSRPWRYQGSREVYAATVISPSGYLRGTTINWNSSLADTIQLAMHIAYERR